jgi:hypothetical protein
MAISEDGVHFLKCHNWHLEYQLVVASRCLGRENKAKFRR